MKPSAFAVAAFLALTATATRAEIVTVTYTGTVSSGYDYVGLFGTPGANLAGEAFTAAYMVDLASGYFLTDSATQSTFVSGSIWGAAVAVNEVLTIGDNSIDISGGDTGVDHACVPSACGQYIVDTGAEEPTADGYIASGTQVYSGAPFTTGDITRSLHYDFGSEVETGSTLVDFDTTTRTYLDFIFVSPTSVTVDGLDASGVPEAASWTLMLAGFGGLGAALRRRRFARAPA